MSYTINNKEYSYNSSINQKIKMEFIKDTVLCNVTNMVTYILSASTYDNNSIFSYEDITNYYIDNSSEIEELENELNNTDLEDEKEDLQFKIDELKQEQETPQEFFECYIVTGFLANRLKEKNNLILEDENIWLRGTFGQFISLDHVISEICFEMEILEGQKNSWENK